MTREAQLPPPGDTGAALDDNAGVTLAQVRAVHPRRAEAAERGGVRLWWEEFATEPSPGGGSVADRPTLLLLPTWQIVASQFWKAQIGTLARHFRVVTFDGRGSGRSGKPKGSAAYTDPECAADVVAVMDATGTRSAVLVALSCASGWAVRVAADQPDRVAAVVAISPSCGLRVPQPDRDLHPFDTPVVDPRDWAMYNKHYWLQGDFERFRRFFFDRMCSEPHSTKQIEDFLAWSADTDPAVLVDATCGRLGLDGATCPPLEEVCRRVHCPVTVIHGTEDRVRPIAIGERLAELTGGVLIAAEGSGHALPAREPVLINRLICDVVRSVNPPASRSAVRPDRTPEGATGGPARRRWVRAARRPRRALFLSSPIGLGHARRDLAIAAELRKAVPDIEIDWLAQHPVTRVLADSGERVHPASAFLLNESRHIESECGEHDLNAFQAIRRMDEILVNNFMVFTELIESENVDLVVGDEAWEVDHFLHENPELKRFRFGWLSDFVGWLPMPDADDSERMLTADLNAEMLEHRARFGPVRDRSIFVGNTGDVVPETFGPGLPPIDAWVRENFEFSGYITGSATSDGPDPAAERTAWGCGPDERLCVVTAGGSGVGGHLLRRVLQAVPIVRSRRPELRFLVVTGPRIDPAALPDTPGATVVGYLPELWRQLACCDIAVVQGGLATCMELTAAGTPFVYVPLRHHFEQHIHVRHRLERYGAGRFLRYEQAAVPELLADAIITEMATEPHYRTVETDGASRAAWMLAELL